MQRRNKDLNVGLNLLPGANLHEITFIISVFHFTRGVMEDFSTRIKRLTGEIITSGWMIWKESFLE